MSGSARRRIKRHASLRWPDCRLVRVTATLRSGAALPREFPAPLDGILAAAARRDRLGDLYGIEVDHHTEALPLVTSYGGPPDERPDCGQRWVWAATCAQFPPATPEDVRWVHQRFDDQPAEQVIDHLPASTTTGRYKSWRIPVVVTLAPVLEWWAVGDPDHVRWLLDQVEQIGEKRSTGEGVVTAWSVEDMGTPVWGPIVWQHGEIARPLPARAAESIGVPGADTIAGSYRPPYWRARMVTEGFAHRQWQEVIAPWTTKPSQATSAV